MKKQYILAALLLIGFGVVYTQAFQLYSIDAAAPDAYAVNTDGTKASVSSVKMRPSKSGDRMIITIRLTDLSAPGSYLIGVELTDTTGTDGYYDLSHPDGVSPSPNGNEMYLIGYYETTYNHPMTSPSNSAVIDIYLDKSHIWLDVDGIMVTLADA